MMQAFTVIQIVITATLKMTVRGVFLDNSMVFSYRLNSTELNFGNFFKYGCVFDFRERENYLVLGSLIVSQSGKLHLYVSTLTINISISRRGRSHCPP